MEYFLSKRERRKKMNTTKKKNKKKKEEGLSVFKTIIVLIFAILITAGITSIVYSFYKILDYKEFDVYVKVTGKNQVGFNLDPGVFNFGKVPQGMKAIRNATVTNHFYKDVLVRIEIDGQVDNMVFVKDNYFIIVPNMTKEVEVIASIPQNQPIGNYSGKLKVYFERP